MERTVYAVVFMRIFFTQPGTSLSAREGGLILALTALNSTDSSLCYIKWTMTYQNLSWLSFALTEDMSCCKFWIYWVGVNTKFTTWQSCHVVNFVFTPAQLIQNLQHDRYNNYSFRKKKSHAWIQLPNFSIYDEELSNHCNSRWFP